MSVLSIPGVTPAQLFALSSLLRASAGRLHEESAVTWLAMTPESAATGKKDDRAREVIRLAEQLGMLEKVDAELVARGTLPNTRREWAATAHALFRESKSDDPDALLLRVYAWFVLAVEARGRASIVNRTVDEVADAIEAELNPDRGPKAPRLFNTTKLTSWRRWMSYLGLGWEDLPGLKGFLPDPSSRLVEELPAMFGRRRELPAEEFLARAAEAMPYLDGGPLFEDARKALRVPPLTTLSSVLSAALRALDAEGAIRLSVTGDQAGVKALSESAFSKVGGFSQIRLGRA